MRVPYIELLFPKTYRVSAPNYECLASRHPAISLPEDVIVHLKLYEEPVTIKLKRLVPRLEVLTRSSFSKSPAPVGQ